MGLREQKKERVRSEILANAIVMFRERGFEAVRVQQIAARSEISEATFFNYFPSKETLLSEWAHTRLDEVLLRAAESAGDAPLRRVLRGAVRVLAREIEGDLDFHSMAWRRARLNRCPVDGPAPEAARRSREALGGLLEAARERAEIRSDLPVEQLAELLRGALQSSVVGWLAAQDRAPLERRLQRGLDLILDGFSRKHERVRLDGSGRASPVSPPHT